MSAVGQPGTIAETMQPRPGLRVLVTAGASGIGAVIARAFLQVEARVHICDSDDDALAGFAEAAPGVTFSRSDVASEEDVERLFRDVDGTLGGLDVLVNNAGIAGPTAGIDEIEPADWRRTVEVNLTGHFLVTRQAVPRLRQAPEAAIINIGSVAGRLGYAYRTPYAASKWGVVGLTESLAKELGPAGIRVNAILPGVVRGERIDRVIADRARALDISFEEMRQRYLQTVSLRRMVEAEDVAAAVLFLCSPGGRNISGQAIGVCGNVETL